MGNTDTTGNNFPRVPGGILTGDHDKAYYKDAEVIRFLFKDAEQYNQIINYQQKVWGQIGPKTKVIEFNNKTLLENEKENK